jgi:C-terminal processing protease CtpA/Prc/Tol biopolymer transport system component
MYKRLCLCLALCLGFMGLYAFEPHFITDPAVSPDGSQVCFVYAGDLWLVSYDGGVAKRLTSTQASEYGPTWSPDGRTLAFSANREGQTWVYTMPAQGGAAEVVFKDGLSVCDWYEDSASLLCTKGSLKWGTSLYKLPLNKQRPTLVAEIADYFSVLSPDNTKIMFNRYGEAYREAYTGSKNGDLWEYDITFGKYTRLTETNYTERYPRYSYKSDDIYFCASDGQRYQLYKAEGGDFEKQVKLTDFDTWSVRDISIARNNDRIAFELFDTIWCYDPLAAEGQRVHKLNIDIKEDTWAEMHKEETVFNRFNEFAVSDDEMLVAFSFKYDLFVMPRKGGEVKQITFNHKGIEDVAFLSDNRTLAFTQYTDGVESLYTVKIDTTMTISPVSWSGKDKYNVDRFYQSGNKWVIEYTDSTGSGRIAVADSSFSNIELIITDKLVSSAFACSPDGTMAIYAVNNPDYALRELYLYDFNSKTSRKIKNDDAWISSLTWLPNQKSVLMRRNGVTKGIFRLDLVPLDEYEFDTDNWKEILSSNENIEEADSTNVKSAKKPISKAVKSKKNDSKLSFDKINWSQIDKRVYQIVGDTGYTYPVSAIDDTSFYYVKEATDNENRKVIASANILGKNILDIGTLAKDWDMQLVKLKTLYYKDGEKLKSLNLKSKSKTEVTSNFKYKYNLLTLNEAVFEQVWGIFGRGFYDPDMHNQDWNALYRLFKPYLSYADSPRILETIIEEMIGEVNASHTGYYARTDTPSKYIETAYLGLELDYSKNLPVGMEINRIYNGNRLYNLYGIRDGDWLISINNVSLTANVSLDSLLSNQVNKKLELVFLKNNQELKCVMKGLSYRENRELWYVDKIDRLRAKTADLSNNKIGYVYIPKMGTEDYKNFVADLFTQNSDKEALIIDIRGNSGGRIHNDLLSFLNKAPNAFTTSRNTGNIRRETPSGTWKKPVALLIDENSFSDAEIFPQLFKESNLGVVIGMPTSGAVIGTWEIKLIDGSSMRMPGSGWYRIDGTNMEGNGAQPDIRIEHTPEDIITENDKQLAKAIEVLKEKLK